MKKIIALLLAAMMVLSLAACAAKAEPAADAAETANTDAPATDAQQEEQTPAAEEEVPAAEEAQPAEPVELIVFAAASMTETLTELGNTYMAQNPNVTIQFNFDSSGTLKTQIRRPEADEPAGYYRGRRDQHRGS